MIFLAIGSSSTTRHLNFSCSMCFLLRGFGQLYLESDGIKALTLIYSKLVLVARVQQFKPAPYVDQPDSVYRTFMLPIIIVCNGETEPVTIKNGPDVNINSLGLYQL